jgi:hypothetical protein
MATNPDKIDISPSVDNILAELEKESFGWEPAISELIDNSLDANAKRIVVRIDMKRKIMEITDDGDGCAEPHLMLVSGESRKRGGRMVGKYGVGLKHASYFIARLDGSTTIRTMHDGKGHSLHVRWNKLVDSRQWLIDAPKPLSRESANMIFPSGRGTHVAFQIGKGRGWMSREQADDMLRKLSFTFSPALRGGRQIVFEVNESKPRLLSAPADPKWKDHIVDEEIVIGNRKARLRAGILAEDDKSGRRGLSYFYSHRVIMPDSAEGAGDYSTNGWAGFVELDHHWTLGQNKRCITDAAMDELCKQIEEKLRPMLDKMQRSTIQVHLDILRNDVSDVLNETFGRPRRPNKLGTTRQQGDAGTDRKVRNAAVVAGAGLARGGGKKSSQGGSFSIDFEERPEESHAARVDENGLRVYLNTAKPMVADAVKARSHNLLAVLAVTHLAYAAETRGQRKFHGEHRFADVVGALASKAQVEMSLGATKGA